MKTKFNKRKFDKVKSPFNLDEIASSMIGADCIFMVKLNDQSFLLAAAKSSQNVICILRDDTDVFVLLAYLVNWANLLTFPLVSWVRCGTWLYRFLIIAPLLTLQCKVQMERWDELGLETNVICTDHGQKSLQLLCMHVLSGCDTTPYPYG